mmetsp:Transcript_3823/g.6730  ORF Transcript_3823/g.6730 Transcript_3823/m.6730 type:complete len:797 (-) Transcript_3823:841-3231(-)
MDFFKKMIDIDQGNADEVDVDSLSRPDLEQMFIVKKEQLKAMTLQYEDLKGESQTTQMEYAALKRKMAAISKQHKSQREMDKKVIMHLRDPNNEVEDPYLASLQERIQQLTDSISALHDENAHLQQKADRLQVENKRIEERKRQEADAYERKVMSWKVAVKEIHEKDQQLLSDLRAKVSAQSTSQSTAIVEELTGRVKQIEEELASKAQALQQMEVEMAEGEKKYETAQQTIKELETRLYTPSAPETNAEPAQDGPVPKDSRSEAAWKEMEADRKTLYERTQEAAVVIEGLQAQVAALQQEQQKARAASEESLNARVQRAVEERSAQLQLRVQALEAAKEYVEEQMRAETLKQDDFERAALAERKQLQKETEEANWESARLEKEIAKLNDKLLAKQREVDALVSGQEKAKDDASRSHLDEVRQLQRQLEEAKDQHEADIGRLSEALADKEAELDILRFRSQRADEPVGSRDAPLHGLHGSEDLATRVAKLQEEAKYREEALEQFCSQSEDLRLQLQDCEEKSAALSADLMTKEMEVEAREKEVHGLREKLQKLVIDHTMAQEAGELQLQELEAECADLRRGQSELEAACKARGEDCEALQAKCKKLQTQLEEEVAQGRQKLEEWRDSKREMDRKLRDMQAQARREPPGPAYQEPTKSIPQQVSNTIATTVSDRLQPRPSRNLAPDRLPPWAPPWAASALTMARGYSQWKFAKAGVVFCFILCILLLSFSMSSTGGDKFADSPEGLQLKSTLAATTADLNSCLQHLEQARAPAKTEPTPQLTQGVPLNAEAHPEPAP